MLQKRVDQIRKKFLNKKLDGVLVSDVVNVAYLTGYSNFSFHEREAFLLLTQDKQYILTDGRYSEAVKKQVNHFEIVEVSAKVPVKKAIKKLSKLNQIKNLGIEENNLTVLEYKTFSKLIKNLKHLDIKKSRAIKDKAEIKLIKRACQLGDQTLQYILGGIKPGITEKELAHEIEFFIKKNGAEISFPPIVAFGKNSSVPHHQTGGTKLGPETSSGREGQIILLDFGVKINDYCSDMTRTLFFGRPSKEQERIYKVVLAAQQKAIDFINTSIKDGKKIKAADVDKVARKYIRFKGYPDIPHSLGHGIGLEVHEHPSLSPKSKEELKIGMVFSIEPGIYIPNFGGVRIEDLFVLEKDHLRPITTSPKEIIQV